ncbi:cysteine desulfurase family protein [soil metagenome]
MRPAPVYLDHAATSPLRPEARAAAIEALDLCGNASSVHAAGRAARDRIETARGTLAAFVNGGAERLVFTSGGVEADNLAISSAVAAGSRRLLIGATEHPGVCVAAQASGAVVESLPVDRRGVVDLDQLAERLARWDAAYGRPFVALMLANNETGVIHPISHAAALVRDAGGWLHVDAVAAAGKLTLDMETLGADTLAVSGPKIGAPQGVGCLAWSDCVTPLRQMHGDGHERGFRSGTENLSGIAAFAAAAEAAEAAARDLPHLAEQSAWRDAAAERIKAQGAVIGGEGAPRTGATLSLAAADWPSTTQVMALDLEGVMVSGGSACSSGKTKPSGVLEAMGFGALAMGSLRASGGWSTTQADWDRFADVWCAAHERRTRRHAPAVSNLIKEHA